jgi:NADPH2:quinone reductase
MPKSVRFYQPGGLEVLVWEEVDVGKPGPGEARVRHTAVGLNYVDIYIRKGFYSLPLPSGIGTEAAGVVEAIGPGVKDIKPGDRVAYAGGPLGAYCEVRVMPADRLVVLPEGISDQQAAAMMLKGLTVQYLIRQIHKVGEGEVILFHAAAGGVGFIACQWAVARRHGHRHGRQRAEGDDRQGARLRLPRHLHARGFRGPGQRAYARSKAAGGL